MAREDEITVDTNFYLVPASNYHPLQVTSTNSSDNQTLSQRPLSSVRKDPGSERKYDYDKLAVSGLGEEFVTSR